jgi:hypothetical protein
VVEPRQATNSEQAVGYGGWDFRVAEGVEEVLRVFSNV